MIGRQTQPAGRHRVGATPSTVRPPAPTAAGRTTLVTGAYPADSPAVLAARQAERYRQARRATNGNLLRWAVALLAVTAVAVLVPLFEIRSYLHDEHLRASVPARWLPVRFVEVHTGKGAWVEVQVDVDPGGPERDEVVSDEFDPDAPPTLGQQLSVVIDPDDSEHVIVAASTSTLGSTVAQAGLDAALFAGFIALLAWGEACPSLRTLRAVRSAPGGPAAATHAVVLRLVVGRPPQGALVALLRCGKNHDVAEIDLELADPSSQADGEPARLTGWFLVRLERPSLRPGDPVVLVGQGGVGGRCALVGGRAAFATSPLTTTPARPDPSPPVSAGPRADRHTAGEQYRQRRRVYIDADGYQRPGPASH